MNECTYTDEAPRKSQKSKIQMYVFDKFMENGAVPCIVDVPVDLIVTRKANGKITNIAPVFEREPVIETGIAFHKLVDEMTEELFYKATLTYYAGPRGNRQDLIDARK